MCGIAAYINIKDRKSISDYAGMLAEGIAHRGPDGLRSYADPDSRFLFIHSLLKIMDRSDAASQPIKDSLGNVLIFNGSIYNYKDLQSKYALSENLNDTQTLLALLGVKGAAILQEIEGMFALVYFSAKEEKYLVARDRYGEKPLFYAHDPLGNWVLASERKSIWNVGVEKQVNKYVALDFLLYNKLGSLCSLYSSVAMVPPGHYGYIRGDNEISFEPIPFLDDVPSGSWDEIMQRSIELSNISDFPIAHTLSGGIDSGGLLSYVSEKRMPEVYSFSSPGFENDEKENTQLVAEKLGIEKVNWVHFPDRISQIMEDWKEISRIHEEPLASPSSMAQYYVYKNIAKDCYRVVLEGQGSDEHFCGYTYYFEGILSEGIVSSAYLLAEATKMEKKTYQKWRLYKSFKPLYSKLYKSKARKLAISIGINQEVWKEYSLGIKDERMESASKGVRNQMSEDRVHGLFQYILRTADRSSMYNHVEVRLPYLYSDIINTAKKLDNQYYWKDGYYKTFLRMKFAKRLPEEIVTQKKKVGFEAPFGLIVESKIFQKYLEEAYAYFKNLGWLSPHAKLEHKSLDTDTYNLLAWKIVALYFAIL